MDPKLDLEARRLFISAALTVRGARSLGGRITASNAEDLLNLARNLDAALVARGHHLSFDPAYPGVTVGVETVRGGLRLLLACHVFTSDGEPIGVVFTTLIPGRSLQVSVAPVQTPVPKGWLPP